MSQLSLFDSDEDRPPTARRLTPKLDALADRQIYFGTSSWKYPGWVGSIYTHDSYMVRGKFSQKKFDSECLAEYARTFSLVGGDFSFYQFPSPEYWARLFENTPKRLLFALKVPEDITVATWPGHARYGKRAGEPNEFFLDPKMFRVAFTRLLEPYRDRVAVLMFEFGTIPKKTMATVDDFLERIEPFLAALPDGFRYGIEIRNPEYLGPAYFETLARHNVAHVFNAWTRMPELPEQADLPGSFTADFLVSRALLPRGRSYEDAVKALEPYESIKEPSPSARVGLVTLGGEAIRRRVPAFLLVNNRLEGHAPGTIEAVADELLDSLPGA